MLLIYTAEQAWTDEERQSCYAESTRYTQQLHESGHYVAAAPLQPVATAASVQVRNGKSIVTDGPFAETREQLGGYYLVECKDLDEALKWASEIPSVHRGPVEVRPIMAFDMG